MLLSVVVSPSCRVSSPFFPVSPPAIKDSCQLAEVYHPSLWCSRNYLCCGSSQRSTSNSTNGCRPVTWLPGSLQHMGSNFSHLIHPASSHSPSPKAPEGDVETSLQTADVQVVEVPPASPTNSHNAVLIPGKNRLPSSENLRKCSQSPANIIQTDVRCPSISRMNGLLSLSSNPLNNDLRILIEYLASRQKFLRDFKRRAVGVSKNL